MNMEGIFDESRRGMTILIIAGVLVVLLIFGGLIWWLFGERATARDSMITTSTQTTVYVDPALCPLCQAQGNGGILANNNGEVISGSGTSGGGTQSGGGSNTGGGSGGQTPDVSGQGSGSSSGGGGFFGSLFSKTPSDLPKGYTITDLSANFRKVRIASAKAYKEGSAATNVDTIILRENIGKNDGAINITGWRLQANQGSYGIQRAAKIYKTTGSSLTNVTLADGQSANIYAGTSAVSANFMGNSCIGYLSTQYNFAPKLPGSCVRPTKNEIATFTGACQEYILKLKTCQAGDPNNSTIPSQDSACRAFVSTINYDGCVKSKQTDPKFFSNVWHVWAGKKFLDPLHDRVLLLDANGKLVDYYLY